MFLIIRVYKLPFRTSQDNLNRLYACNRISAQIWNQCLDLAKEHGQRTNTWLSRKELHLATKGRYPIHSQSIQAVYEKYLDARENALQARALGYTQIRYPYKEKHHFNTRWKKDGFRIGEKGRIELSLGLWEGKRQKPITVRVAHCPPGQIKEIELVYDRGLKLAMAFEDGISPKANPAQGTAAIDLGEIHTLASVTDQGQGLLITGRKLRSIKRLRNKKLKELQRKMAHCQKGSRQWKKYRRAFHYVLSKSEAQLTDALHKTTREFVRWCLDNAVKDVVIGDVEGIQRHTSPKKKQTQRKRSRRINQNLSQWTFGKTRRYLQYKLAAEGISLKKVDEAYTTQTCPVCGKRRVPSSRTYHCGCGYVQHRDLHGAGNILTQHLYGHYQAIVLKDYKYLRIA
ncbi:transposase, IS605 OrfB family [Desulfitobacterium hafniense DCB-2]|uniref:Transposase n=2 Tax=Desulfitobacterium hafniense TaxID=49338 RepID=A0A0W1JK17_DESHA|nr:RNA-guided endonuclease TnpB family protein [Desulfitobacterium hafniense]ACL18587.1 transposase, IS605 OrfB family [Desulfitobacterium hafniense DCB-2]KTE91797.1 transposase [Desulfitobacterium hafniense]